MTPTDWTQHDGSECPVAVKPCPFCGSQAKQYHRDEGSGWSNTDWVCCDNEDCGCQTCLHETPAIAVAAWNSRAPVTAPVAERDDVEPIGWQWSLHRDWFSVDKTKVDDPESYARGMAKSTGGAARAIYAAAPSVAADKAEIARLTAERDSARETNREFHRRVQFAERFRRSRKDLNKLFWILIQRHINSEIAATLRAQTAESQIVALKAERDGLVSALKPFAALYTESMRDFPDGSHKAERPDDRHAWGFNNVDITWGDFRRAALEASKERT